MCGRVFPKISNFVAEFVETCDHNFEVWAEDN